MPARLPVYTGQEEGWALSHSLDYQELREAPTGASCLREGVEPSWERRPGKVGGSGSATKVEGACPWCGCRQAPGLGLGQMHSCSCRGRAPHLSRVCFSTRPKASRRACGLMARMPAF